MFTKGTTGGGLAEMGRLWHNGGDDERGSRSQDCGGVITYGGFLLAAVVLMVLARLSPLFPGDLGLSQAIQSLDSPRVEGIMSGISFPGVFPRSLVITLGLAIILWVFRRRLEALFVAITLISYPMGLVIKALVSRPRPDAELLRVLEMGSTEGSFPSGHVLFVTVFLGFLLYLASTRLGGGFWQWLCQGILILAIVGTGLSRIYLGAHWPSDVLGGYLVGGLILAPIIGLYRGFVAPRWGNYAMG